jgi:hypothetical protein
LDFKINHVRTAKNREGAKTNDKNRMREPKLASILVRSMSAIDFETGLKEFTKSQTGRVAKNTASGIRVLWSLIGFIRCHAANVKNKESRIADNHHAISAAVTQYTPRPIRARAISVPQGNTTFTMRETGKVAKNIKSSI